MTSKNKHGESMSFVVTQFGTRDGRIINQLIARINGAGAHVCPRFKDKGRDVSAVIELERGQRRLLNRFRTGFGFEDLSIQLQAA